MNVAFVIIYLVYMLVVLGFGIASYVLSSLGCYTIAKRRGIHNPWMAWVPVASAYLLGSISDQYQYVVKGKNKARRKLLLGFEIAMILALVLLVVYVAAMGMNVADESAVVGFVIGVFGVYFLIFGVAIAYCVFRYMALYDLYSSCNPDHCVMFLLLSIFIGVTEPFFVFFNRKKDDGMPSRKTEPVMLEEPTES